MDDRTEGLVTIVIKQNGATRVAHVSARRSRDEWLCGYAAALANIIRYHGETTLAKMAMDSDGLTLKHFVQAGVERYDLVALKRAR
jgi:hypothetical protein